MEVARAEVFRCLRAARSTLCLRERRWEVFCESFWRRGRACVAVAGWRRSWSQARLCVWVLCLGCWHVRDDLVSVGAMRAGGRLMLEVARVALEPLVLQGVLKQGNERAGVEKRPKWEE